MLSKCSQTARRSGSRSLRSISQHQRASARPTTARPWLATSARAMHALRTVAYKSVGETRRECGARWLSTTAPLDKASGVSQLRQRFELCKSEGRAAFVGYLTAGFPAAGDTVAALKTMQDNGVDVIEIGVPFTDPLADGPTIQRANQRALDGGVDSVEHCLKLAKEARAAGVTVPMILMGYWNPFMQFQGNLMEACAEAGVHGFIVVDMPPEEASTFRSQCQEYGLSYVPLVAPTTTDDRMKVLCSVADSFIYAVSVTGVTGARAAVANDLGAFVKRIHACTDTPVAVGFGIGDQKNFQEVSEMAEGVVVGSAIINQMATDKPLAERLDDLGKFCADVCQRSSEAPTEASKRTPSTDPFETTDQKPYNDAAMFGEFGGSYVPETLTHALDELETEYAKCKDDPEFIAEVEAYNDYIGRPSSFHRAERLTEYAGGAQIWLKREDLNHTGAHKINNAIAQCLLAQRIGKTRIIAETGAGQHGVATATICAKLGLPLTVYMGKVDVERQMLNVFRMRLMGAKVVPVDSGSSTLKDAINEAMRDWVTNIRDTHYLVGSAIGPHPFPTIVRDFQSVIGRETKLQCQEQIGKLPDALVACVGGGSNAIGFFHPFLEDKSVRLVGVEAGGSGVSSGSHSATLTAGTPGVLHGTRTYLLQDTKTGQIGGTSSISAGLDYPGVGPEHAHLKFCGRAEYMAVTDEEALMGFVRMSRTEGIIPALETSHAVTGAIEVASKMPKTANVVLCVSGRGDKDLDMVNKYMEEERFARVKAELHKCFNTSCEGYSASAGGSCCLSM